MFEIFNGKRILICGAGGFLGNQFTKKLKELGAWVRGVDLRYPEYNEHYADEFLIRDLREYYSCNLALDESIDYVIQFAALFGGAVFVFSGDQDADIVHNNTLINLHIAKIAARKKIKRVLYSSSACVYPLYNQSDPNNPKCTEDSVFPANPDSAYGLEKVYSESIYNSFHKNYGLDIRISRFHNIMGPGAQYDQLRAKAPAAICRKVIECPNNGTIEIIGDGKQTRSFLDIEECLEGTLRLFESDYTGALNIGSEEMISINNLAKMIIEVSGKNIKIKNIEGPTGVRGRNSDNTLIKKTLNWAPSQPLRVGIEKLYKWIEQQVNKNG